MREIRFRVWSALTEQMYQVGTLHWGSSQPNIVGWNLDTKHGCSILSWDSLGVHLMQYTGLKDKNGNEIYEGDIALCPIWEDYDKGKMTQEKGIVKWDDRDAMFSIFSNIMEDGYMLDNACNIEVIGNIYENPELLEVKG